MFDFLFRRKPQDLTPAQQTPAAVQPREQQAQLAKQQRLDALRALEGIAQDEAAVVEFLLACEFADGRLAAAQHVHSEAALARVAAAMRNTDKRVAKLVQSRLDVIHQNKQIATAMQDCIAVATALDAEALLLPNQVADLDRRFAAISSPPQGMLQQFDTLRRALEARLQRQAGLQRNRLDALAALRALAASHQDLPHGQAEAALGRLQTEFDRDMAKPEALALPRNLAGEFSDMAAALRTSLVERKEDELRQAQEQQVADRKALEQASTLDVTETELASGEAVTAEPVQAVEAEKEHPKLEKRSASEILESIQGLEDALNQGSVQLAQKLDRDLRNVDFKVPGVSREQRERLIRLRGELSQLLAWARWGGGVSREELVKAAQDLPGLQLQPAELAKRVGSLRDRWKSLEALSGPAGKTIWESFDAACSLAYAPAAAYFQEMAGQRASNLAKAEALLAQVQGYSGLLLQDAVDWKAVASALMQAKQHWRALGALDRKQRSRIEQAFESACQLLEAPLEARRKQEVASRRDIIAQVRALDAAQQGVSDKVRALQGSWQQQAAALPLRRKDEQSLWEEFRAACDAVFAQRRAAADSADASRRQNLQGKEAICAELEQAGQLDEAAARDLLRKAGAAWRDAGHVPREEEARIAQRYQRAVDALNAVVQGAQQKKRQAAGRLLSEKLRLCRQIEDVLQTGQPADAQALRAQWQALGKAQALLPLDVALERRFSDAERMVAGAGHAGIETYRQQLQANLAALDTVLLQLEILHGLDSPAALARERLKVQVEVLQAALKSGERSKASNQALLQLCALPAAAGAAQLARADAILQAATAAVK
jgi:hypothetical protein